MEIRTMATPVKAAATPAPAPAVVPRVAAYPETATITLLKANPKRGASGLRYAAYGATVGAKTTVKDYLDACLALQPDEPRYRWRADLAWDLKRGFIAIE